MIPIIVGVTPRMTAHEAAQHLVRQQCHHERLCELVLSPATCSKGTVACCQAGEAVTDLSPIYSMEVCGLQPVLIEWSALTSDRQPTIEYVDIPILNELVQSRSLNKPHIVTPVSPAQKTTHRFLAPHARRSPSTAPSRQRMRPSPDMQSSQN